MNDLIKFLLSVSTISLVVGYLARVILDKILDARIEKYKSGLNNESEKFISELSRINTEHQIRFSKLHDERAVKIKNIHDLLYELETCLKHLTSVFQGPEWTTDNSREESAKQKIKELIEALEFNRIYFSDELCDKIENVGEKCLDVVRKMMLIKLEEKRREQLINSNRPQLIDSEAQDPIEKWNETNHYVTSVIKVIRLELVKEFRKLIGVN